MSNPNLRGDNMSDSDKNWLDFEKTGNIDSYIKYKSIGKDSFGSGDDGNNQDERLDNKSI